MQPWALVDLATLLDDNFRMTATKYLKGPIDETETRPCNAS